MKWNVPFYQVPNCIFDINLSVYEIVVYSYLCRCQGGNSNAFPTVRTIARRCGIGKTKAGQVINSLIEKRLISKSNRVQNGAYKSNLYIVLDPSKGVGVTHQPDKLGQQSDNPSPLGDQRSILIEEDKIIKKQYNNGRSSEGQITTGYFLVNNDNYDIEETLEYFYYIYKQHLGKEHPKLKPIQLERIYETVDSFMKSDMSVDFDGLKVMIDRYFEINLKCDRNLNHFATQGILEKRYYETIY